MCKKYGTLYTSNFSKISKGKGINISVARFNPKWLKSGQLNEWFENLAPSITLLENYKSNKISWENFTNIYIEEISNSPESLQELDEINKLLKSDKDVTIYCYESPLDNCHRFILRDIFKSDYNVKEIF